MLKGFGDLANLIKNARDIQQKVDSLKQSLVETPAEGVSGGGLVRIKGRADGTVQSVDLDPATVQRGDVEMLEDLVLAAINSFNQNLAEHRRAKLAELTGGLGLPPGMDLGL
ncbi:MAG: YbaB/EbfC family nucleoid-associated protein [Candidatus Omnitrophica bacterium]|nr:Nucleoid-associated protein YbaB [bacterium]NUN98269.1 YbaB/EbfC family nucleoid-associated protein [Candidatus Omnitrophota bacterium]